MKTKLSETNLTEIGFKLKKLDGYIWYERKIKGASFITNDQHTVRTQKTWNVGFQLDYMTDHIFPKSCDNVEDTKALIQGLTGKET